MALSREEVEQIAHLARLHLTEEEIVQYQAELSDILAYAERLNDLDLEGIEETTHAVKARNVFRKDSAKAPLSNEDAIKNGAQTADGQFIVQAVLDE